MKRFLGFLAVVATLFIASVGSASADNLHLCNSGTTDCSNGAMTLIPTGTNLYVWGSNSGGGNVYIAILTPESDTSDGFTGSNSFYDNAVLGLGTLTSTPSQPNFSNLESNYNGASGLTASSFDVSLCNLGNLSLSVTSGTLVTGCTVPTGDVALAFILNGTSVTAVSPNSSDFLVGNVSTPEPGSLALLALGLCALGFVKFRHSALVS